MFMVNVPFVIVTIITPKNSIITAKYCKGFIFSL
jgi:hypothetical protein